MSVSATRLIKKLIKTKIPQRKRLDEENHNEWRRQWKIKQLSNEETSLIRKIRILKRKRHAISLKLRKWFAENIVVLFLLFNLPISDCKISLRFLLRNIFLWKLSEVYMQLILYGVDTLCIKFIKFWKKLLKWRLKSHDSWKKRITNYQQTTKLIFLLKKTITTKDRNKLYCLIVDVYFSGIRSISLFDPTPRKA